MNDITYDVAVALKGMVPEVTVSVIKSVDGNREGVILAYTNDEFREGEVYLIRIDRLSVPA